MKLGLTMNKEILMRVWMLYIAPNVLRETRQSQTTKNTISNSEQGKSISEKIDMKVTAFHTCVLYVA